MPLLSIWKSNPAEISSFNTEQIVSISGNGDLKDFSECSIELRTYLSQAETDKLAEYLDYCLTSNFNKSGSVLQDIVNELGSRLDYEVEGGRYQGVTNAIGYDGIWTAPEENSLIIEVKTTDAYRLSLDKLAVYKKKLLEAGRITDKSSILIITGRSDTGELEAQIRGSRHAWDIRLISADALIKLVRIRQSTEGHDTAKKIRQVLIPVEFTKLDALIDVIFAAAKDIEITTQSEVAVQLEDVSDSKPSSSWSFTGPAELSSKRNELIGALSKRMNTSFVKSSRALYHNTSKQVRAAVTLSKRYPKKGYSPYWYAYHPQWDTYLGEAKEGYLVLGCMDRSEAYALPLTLVREYLSQLDTTTREDRLYWHVKLVDNENGGLSLRLPRSASHVSLDEYRFDLR